VVIKELGHVLLVRSSTLRDMGSCEEEGLFSRSLTILQNFLRLDPQLTLAFRIS
jgi:hypothetical protein